MDIYVWQYVTGLLRPDEMSWDTALSGILSQYKYTTFQLYCLYLLLYSVVLQRLVHVLRAIVLLIS